MEIRYQIQFYTTNDLLIHPIVSPALAYLGGLPPLFFGCEWVRGAQGRDCMRAWATRTFMPMGCVRAHRPTNPEKYAVGCCEEVVPGDRK